MFHGNDLNFTSDLDLLTNISIASFLIHRQTVQTHTPQNVASDQGLPCLLTVCSIKI